MPKFRVAPRTHLPFTAPGQPKNLVTLGPGELLPEGLEPELVKSWVEKGLVTAHLTPGETMQAIEAAPPAPPGGTDPATAAAPPAPPAV